MSTSLVSVIILTWNRLNDLSETIREVKKSSYVNIEIIVVDNGSTDGTLEFVKKHHPNIRYIFLQKNIGIAGYNAGMKEAKGDYIVVLDSDSFPEKGSLKRMVQHLDQNPDIGVAAFDVRNYDYRDTIKASSSKPLEVTGYNGAGAGIRKQCLDSAGLLFEPLFLYFNEQDHSLRILENGYRIVFFPDLLAFHKQSKINRSAEKTAYFYTRNILWLVWRHYPAWKMVLYTFKIFFLGSLFSIRLRNNVYFRAISDAIAGAGPVFKSRSPVRKEIIQRARVPINLAFTVFG